MGFRELRGKIDEICDMIVDGKQLREIARHYNEDLSALYRYLNKEENIKAYLLALELSSRTFDDMAEEVLKTCPATRDEIARARELAQHYRWRAKARNPRQFGEKVDLTTDGEKITPTTLTVTVIKPDEY